MRVAPIYIDASGAIVFGDVCIDGHVSGCLYRIVTHAHHDHVVALNRSAVESRYILATCITHELLEELGFYIPKRKRISLSYGDRFCIDSEARIRLEYAHHIPGASQVIIESSEGTYAYSGDFKGVSSKTKPPSDVDVLIVDATYGDPAFRRPSEDIIVEELVKLLRQLLARGPVNIYAYYGKAQEVMLILREYGIDAPFIACSKHWRIARRLEKFGYRFKDLILEGSREAYEIMRDGWYIKFEHFSRYRIARNDASNHSHVLLTGWLFQIPFRNVGKNRWIVAFSDHADFDELVLYIDMSRPRRVIVDASRGGSVAKRFAEYISSVMRIRAEAQP